MINVVPGMVITYGWGQAHASLQKEGGYLSDKYWKA